MTNKEEFVEVVEEMLTEAGDKVSENVWDYFEEIKKHKVKSRAVTMTDNGAAIIGFMQDEIEEYDNKFLSSQIAEGLFTSSRSVSGAMRKLVNDGFVDKNESSPLVYNLTDKGKEYKLED